MNSVLIDTNVLVLLVVGTADRELIGLHRRTREFLARDYDEVVGLLARFDQFWITSHCLAETSNLLKQTNNKHVRGLLGTLAGFCSGVRESCVPKNQILADRHFLQFGVADTGFIQKSKRVNCSITTDLQLYVTISRLGRNVINFNHHRAAYLTT